jgi:predicted Zn-dependent protease
MNTELHKTLSLLLVTLLLTGCVVSRDPITGDKSSYGYSWADEVRMGAEGDGQIISQYGAYDDERLGAYVDSLGQALVALSHLQREGAEAEWVATQFYFRVLDTPVVNAFALPGGYIYVTRGLLAHVENEAQLAVVIGHEIGHVTARHMSKRAKNQILSQVALMAGAVGGQLLIGGNTAEQVLNYGGIGTQLLLLSYGRDDESQSDQLGVEYAALAGYEASEGAGFFNTLKRLSDQSGQEIPSFLQTHPDPGQRGKKIIEEAALWRNEAGARRVGRSWYLQEIDDMIYASNPRQGFNHEGRFVHPDLAFQFDIPGEFRLTNQPSQVVMISEDGQAAARLMIDTEHASAEAAAEDMAVQKGIVVLDRGSATYHGVPSHFILAEILVENAEAIRFRMHFMNYGGNVYSFLGFTEKSDFVAYDKVFAPMINSFRPLLDKTLLEIEPRRIRIEQSQIAESFQVLIDGETSSDITANTLAILNQINLGDAVARGYHYKLVR